MSIINIFNTDENKKNSVLFLFIYLLIIIVYGAIPFYSMPTLGQIVWASGFAESFATNEYMIYANNFGIPNKAPIAFGLPGVYLQSLLIQYTELHASDAYSFMSIFILGFALFGSINFSLLLGASYRNSLFFSMIYLTLPIVWWHTSYSFLSFGFALLPLYIFSAFKLLSVNIKSPKMTTIFLFISVSIIAIFMDGYTFMMFATATMIIYLNTFIREKKIRIFLLFRTLPFILISFGLAYISYTSYIGVSTFESWPIDYFRGFGVDITMLFIPSKGIIWLFDFLGLSVARSGINYFGDTSAWATTFAGFFIVIGLLSYLLSGYHKHKASLLLIALFGLYMSLGPSLKINSLRSIDQIQAKNFTHSMKKEEAICSTGSALLSEHIPGFKNMRATYRWSGLLFVGLFGLIIIGLNKLIEIKKKRIAYIATIIIIIFNLPNLIERTQQTYNNRNAMHQMDIDIITPLKKDIKKNSVVAFVPHYNDHFANYLAAKSHIKTFNVGGDKNLEMAKKNWPKTMLAFKQLEPSDNFIDNIKNILLFKDADYVVIPYFHMLWGAYGWPRKESEILKYKRKYLNYKDYFKNNTDYKVVENNLYLSISLEKNIDFKKLQNEQKLSMECQTPSCIFKVITQGSTVRHIVGKITSSGIVTNKKEGTLLFGPYRSLEKGNYSLHLYGEDYAKNGSNYIVLITSNLGQNILSKFHMSSTNASEIKEVLNNIKIESDVTGVEIKVIVNKQTDIKISKYILRQKEKMQNETNNPNPLLQ